MTEYKRNHTIPRAMIQYWVDHSTIHKGVHVYEIESRRSYISTGKGSSPFSFAIVNDLHVSTVAGKRAVELEKWFSTVESALLLFVRQAHEKKVPITFQPPESLANTLKALIGLEVRSPYNLRLIEAEIERNDALRRALSDGKDSPAKNEALDNLLQSVHEQLFYVTPPELNVVFSPPNRSWILSDRPFVKLTDDPSGLRIVVLSNKVALMYQRAEDGVANCGYSDVTDEVFDDINRGVALSARRWIVADSRESLTQYEELTNGDEWRNQVAQDKISFLPIKFLKTAWTIVR